MLAWHGAVVLAAYAQEKGMVLAKAHPVLPPPPCEREQLDVRFFNSVPTEGCVITSVHSIHFKARNNQYCRLKSVVF